MPEYTNDPVFSGILYVGSKPELKQIGDNEALTFRGGHTTSYGDGGSDWYDCAIWDEVLIENIGQQLYKGAVVAVEGFIKTKTGNNGQEWKNIRVVKLGQVAWFARRDKNAKPAAAKPAPAPVAATAAPTLEQIAAYLQSVGAAPAAPGASTHGKDSLPF